jgi:hypothetical protein
MHETPNCNASDSKDSGVFSAQGRGLIARKAAKLLEITEKPRGLPNDLDCEQPLITVCWRILREERERLKQIQKQDAATTEAALVSLALEAYSLGSQVRSIKTHEGAALTPVEIGGLEGIRGRLLQALETLGIRLLSPEGDAYTGNLVEFFDSVAQKPDPASKEPKIAEVIIHAVLLHGTLAQQGRAVIAVPGTVPE